MRVYQLIITVLVGFMLNACSLKNPSDPKSADTPHQMGVQMDVRYYALGGKLMQKIAHHTYPEAFDANGTRYAWKALGSDIGGDILADTTTKCDSNKNCIDISTINYIMMQAPCIWPREHYYAVVGVCWNATNRGLYYTGKTVHNVPFYTLIEKVYGTYGLDTNSACWYNLNPFRCEEGKKKYAWSQCLASVQEKMPWSTPQTPLLQHLLNPRIKLYHEYQQANTTEEAYLQKLFEHNIQEKLGDISKEQKEALLGIDQKHRAKRAKMSQNALQTTPEKFDHERHLETLNQLFNEELEEYKQVLSDEAYLKLFGASKSLVFDIRNQ